MSGTFDCFASIRKHIGLPNGDKPSRLGRRTVRPQLERLENRDLLSTTVSVGPPNIGQVAQQLQLLVQLVQVEANPATVGPQGIENMLGYVVTQLPGLSQSLNYASSLLPTIFGPQVGQQYTSFLVRGVDFLLTGLETEAQIAADILAAGGTGIPGNPNLNLWDQAINYFLSNPLNDPYSVPPGAFGS
jgi:hypothetical protein